MNAKIVAAIAEEIKEPIGNLPWTMVCRVVEKYVDLASKELVRLSACSRPFYFSFTSSPAEQFRQSLTQLKQYYFAYFREDPRFQEIYNRYETIRAFPVDTNGWEELAGAAKVSLCLFLMDMAIPIKEAPEHIPEMTTVAEA